MSEDQLQPPGDADPFGTGAPPTGEFLRNPVVESDPPGDGDLAPTAEPSTPSANGQQAQPQLDPARFDAMERELTHLNQRFRDTQSWAQRSNAEREQAVRRAEALENALRQQAQMAQTAAAWEIPDPENPDAFLEDGKAVGNYVKENLARTRGQILGALQPHLQQLNAVQAQLEQLRPVVVSTTRQIARQNWEKRGYDPEVFDEMQGDIDRWMESDPNAYQQVTNPDGMVVATQWYANQRGRSIVGKSPAPKPKANLATPTNPPADKPKQGLTAEEKSMHRQVAKAFGLPFEPDKVAERMRR